MAETDRTAVTAIRARGGCAKRVNILQAGYGELKLSKVGQFAAQGDSYAIQAFKMVNKPAARPGEGSRDHSVQRDTAGDARRSPDSELPGAALMQSLARKVVDGFGALVRITGSNEFEYPLGGPTRLSEVEFVFTHGTVLIAARDDDTVEMSEGNLTHTHRVDLASLRPWSDAISSRGLGWIWLMKNQNGYLDGIQLQFLRHDGSFTVQMICEASELSVGVVSPLLCAPR